MADVGREPAELLALAAELGVALDPNQADALLRFRDLLLRWNRAFNLVSRRDTDRLLTRHLLDSLSVTPWLEGTQVLDLGTGPGLPGVPLAIAREDANFTLIDLSERKIRFVGQVVRSLGLANVTARCGDVRGLPQADVFDSVVCRAVADPAIVWALAAPRLRAGGRMVIMSRAGGRAGLPEASAPPEPPPGARLEEHRRIRIPGLGRPHELMLLKHGASGPQGSAA